MPIFPFPYYALPSQITCLQLLPSGFSTQSAFVFNNCHICGDKSSYSKNINGERGVIFFVLFFSLDGDRWGYWFRLHLGHLRTIATSVFEDQAVALNLGFLVDLLLHHCFRATTEHPVLRALQQEAHGLHVPLLRC